MLDSGPAPDSEPDQLPNFESEGPISRSIAQFRGRLPISRPTPLLQGVWVRGRKAKYYDGQTSSIGLTFELSTEQSTMLADSANDSEQTALTGNGCTVLDNDVYIAID